MSKLPPDANKIIYVKGLPYKISDTELYDLFGKYGAVQQIRLYDLLLLILSIIY